MVSSGPNLPATPPLYSDPMTPALPEPYAAAAVQRAPAWGDLQAGLALAIDAIDEAAREGASLIVLPEAWLPGYPYWCTEQRPNRAVRQLFRELTENSVEIPGPEVAALGEAAKRASATVVVGVTERAGGTLYNTLCYFGPDGALLGSHRKLVPTLSERTVWGMGDGSDLDAYDTPAGRLSGLICYEHFMAPARYALAGPRCAGACLRLARLPLRFTPTSTPPRACSPSRTPAPSSSPARSCPPAASRPGRPSPSTPACGR